MFPCSHYQPQCMCLCVKIFVCLNVAMCPSVTVRKCVYPSVATILSAEGVFVHVCMCVFVCEYTSTHVCVLVGVFSQCTLESSWRGEKRGISICRLQLWVIFQQQQN